MHVNHVNAVIGRVNNSDLRETLIKVIKSSKFPLEVRRRILNEFKEVAAPIPELQICEGHYLTEKQYNWLRNNEMSHYIPTAIELADSSVNATITDLAFEMQEFMTESGMPDFAHSNFEKSCLTAMIKLGGFEFRLARNEHSKMSRVCRSMKTCETLTVGERIDMAMKRCNRLGLINLDMGVI